MTKTLATQSPDNKLQSYMQNMIDKQYIYNPYMLQKAHRRAIVSVETVTQTITHQSQETKTDRSDFDALPNLQKNDVFSKVFRHGNKTK